MFKKTILATSLLGLATSGNAAVLSLGVAPQHTKEGLLTAAVTAARAANYKLQLKAEYALGDTIQFTYSTPVTADIFPATIVFDNGTGTSDTVTFGLLNYSTSQATYRVTQLSDQGGNGVVTTDLTGITPLVTLDPTSLAAVASATVTFGATTATGTSFDTTAAPTKNIATVVDQFTVTGVGKFNGVIDVNATRLAFVDQTAGNSTDALTYTLGSAAGTAGKKVTKAIGGAAATAGHAVHVATLATNVTTLTGSTGFSWLDEDTTTAGMNLTSNSITKTKGTDTLTYSTDLASMIFSDTNNVGAGGVTIDKAVTTLAIPVMTMSASTVFTYDTSKTTTVAFDAGSFALNAASITAYAVPFSSSVTRMLWVANNGSSTGDITATVTSDGTANGPYSLGTIAGKSQAYISTLLDTALADAGVAITGRANVQVDVTAPTADIVLTAAYKVDSAGDRLHLETSDTLEDAITVSGTVAAVTGCTDTALGSLVVDATASGQIKASVTSGVAATTDDGAQLTFTDIDCAAGAGGGTISTTTIAK